MRATTPRSNRKSQDCITEGPEHLVFAGGSALLRLTLTPTVSKGNNQGEVSTPKGADVSKAEDFFQSRCKISLNSVLAGGSWLGLKRYLRVLGRSIWALVSSQCLGSRPTPVTAAYVPLYGWEGRGFQLPGNLSRVREPRSDRPGFWPLWPRRSILF